MRTIFKILMFLVLLATIVGVVYVLWNMTYGCVGTDLGEALDVYE